MRLRHPSLSVVAVFSRCVHLFSLESQSEREGESELVSTDAFPNDYTAQTNMVGTGIGREYQLSSPGFILFHLPRGENRDNLGLSILVPCLGRSKVVLRSVLNAVEKF